MKDLTPKSLRRLFLTVEINLILWLWVATSLWNSKEQAHVSHIATAGFIFAALFQHWAYYNLYRRAKANENSGAKE